MRTNQRSMSLGLAVAGALMAVALPAQSQAQVRDVYLRAQQFNMPIADGSGNGNGTTPVPMWGYRLCDATFANAGCGPVTSPGPVIEMAADETTLRIHMQNRLPAGLTNVTNATSMVVPGLQKPLNPVTFTDADGRERIRSFDMETPRTGAGNTDTIYEWTNVPPGTFLYHSGTHPQVQVQMGLYGAIVKNAVDADATASILAEAYPGVTYDDDAVVVFSEVDPALHEAVVNDNYANTSCPVGEFCPTSTERYEPRFFLINGAAYRPNADPIDIGGGNALLRLVNAGIQSHAPQVLGGYFDVIAEDAHVAPVVRSQHTTLLAAAKTMDVRFAPGAGSYPLFDRTGRMVNDSSLAGGMFTRLRLGNTAPVAGDDLFCIQSPVASPAADACTFQGGNVLNGVLNTGAPGVLANDVDAEGDPIRVTPGSVIVDPAAPAGTIAVNTGVAATAAGRLIVNLTSDTWIGATSLTYTVSENFPGVALADQLVSAPATARIVRDMRIDSRQFLNDQGTTNDSWNLSGTLRTVPDAGTVTVSFVQNPANTNCALVGMGLDGTTGAPTAPTVIPVAGDGTWSYTAARPNPGGCGWIRIEADMLGDATIPAHATALQTSLQRVDPTP